MLPLECLSLRPLLPSAAADVFGEAIETFPIRLCCACCSAVSGPKLKSSRSFSFAEDGDAHFSDVRGVETTRLGMGPSAGLLTRMSDLCGSGG